MNNRLGIDIPYGHCHCGCGGKTRLARQNHTALGYIKGEPVRFIQGHHVRYLRPNAEEFGHFKIGGVYCRLIPISRGLYAIVDETDYRWLSQWDWFARWVPHIKSFYVCRWAPRTDGKKGVREVRMHRKILGLDSTDSRLSDHIDPLRTLENTRNNLRPANTAENCRNSRRSSKNTSGFKGVSYDKARNKWKATICVNGKFKHLGRFNTKEEAYAAYCAAARLYFGEFARIV